MTEIIPGLFLGDWNPLPAIQVGAIVDCQEVDLTAGIVVPTLWLPFRDEPKLPPLQYLSAANEFIAGMLRAKLTVLVHCFAGHNRSGLVVASYLIVRHGIGPGLAIALIREKRGPEALSNKTFTDYLERL